MTKNIQKQKSQISRGFLGNPFPRETKYERLIKSKAVDLRDNIQYIDLNNGYLEILPINPNKIFE